MIAGVATLVDVRVFSDLNLNGKNPMRAQPRVGDWGPEKVPSTRWKKWQRVLVPIIAVLLAVGVFFLGRMFYLGMTQPQAVALLVNPPLTLSILPGAL